MFNTKFFDNFRADYEPIDTKHFKKLDFFNKSIISGAFYITTLWKKLKT